MSTGTPTYTDITAELLASPTPLRVAKSLKSFAALGPDGFKPLKVGVVSSFTFDPLTKPLIASGYCDRFALEVYNAPFGQFTQELINPKSGLHAFAPDVVFIAVRLQDACPPLYEGFNALDGDGVRSLVERWKSNFSAALETLRSLSDARILCAGYEQPAYPNLGLADRQANPSQVATITALNNWLYGLRGSIRNLHILDVDGIAARCGRDGWIDPKSWYWARLPIAPAHHWAYARGVTQLLRATTGKARKVLALDCDNTLWGGVLGDVGPEGIELGHDFPGNAYRAFQMRALDLYHRGVVLILASKNEQANVAKVFESHPEMVLRPEHIAYYGVNWDPKPQNLRRAAEVLNLGIDSFVFVDDHPVECALVRDMLPEVLTVQLPEDPAEYERTLARLDCFDQVTISAEDRERGKMYRAEAQRSSLRTSAADLESFYRDLQMRAIVSVDSPEAVARAAQLTQRTNQFNMTTIRRTESEIRELMTGDRHGVYTIRLVDRFGDAGIVGLAIVEFGETDAVIETYLMSCRILGRTVENTFLAYVGRQALDRGLQKLVGLYAASAKNKPFGGFYESAGLHLEGAGDDGVQRWSCALSADSPVLTIPDWISLEVA